MAQATPHEGYTPPEDALDLEARTVEWESVSVRILTAKLRLSAFNPDEMERDKVPDVARFVGDKLAEYAKQSLAAHAIPTSIRKQLFIIPGSTEAGLKSYTKKGGDIHDKDKAHRDRALEFQQRYASVAHEMRQSYPEVALAEAAEATWHRKGWEEASDAMLILLSSYGLRIQNILDVQKQREAWMQDKYDAGPYFGRLVRPPEVPHEHL